MSKHILMPKKGNRFCFRCINGYTSQYKATVDLQLFGLSKRKYRGGSLPPVGNNAFNSYPQYTQSSNNEQRIGYCYAPSASPTEHSSQNRSCSMCQWNKKDLAFGCGH